LKFGSKSLLKPLLVFCALLIGTNAFGSSISYTCAIPAGSVQFTVDCNEPLFDAGPDFVLTGVTLTLSSTATVDMGILNTDTISHNYTISASVPMTVTGPGPYSITSTPSVGPESGPLGPGDFNEFTGLVGSAGPETEEVLPEDFDLFIGSGSQSFDFQAQGGPIDLNATSDATAPYEIWFTDSATESATFTVEYDYTTIPGVPEPPASTLFITGAAMISLSLLRAGTFRKP
jgi:hypothetical protein